jgi:hypothetical protein
VTHSLAAVAEAALANLEDLPAGMSGLARSDRPASPAERRDAIAQAWQDEPGISDTALAERFGVSGRTIQRDTQALQVLARWAIQRARVGGHGGRGLSSASLRLECSALRQLVRHAGRPELAANLRASRRQAPPPETIPRPVRAAAACT